MYIYISYELTKYIIMKQKCVHTIHRKLKAVYYYVHLQEVIFFFFFK